MYLLFYSYGSIAHHHHQNYCFLSLVVIVRIFIFLIWIYTFRSQFNNLIPETEIHCLITGLWIFFRSISLFLLFFFGHIVQIHCFDMMIIIIKNICLHTVIIMMMMMMISPNRPNHWAIKMKFHSVSCILWWLYSGILYIIIIRINSHFNHPSI